MGSLELLALFKLPTLFGGTYGIRLFYRESEGAKLLNVYVFTGLCLCILEHIPTLLITFLTLHIKTFVTIFKY